MAAKIVERLPQWITGPARQRRTWLLILRACVASWASLVLILPQPSITRIGNAAFFTFLASFILPPTMPAQALFLALTTLALGALFGWAWGCAAMATALSVRDQTVTQATITRISSSEEAKANIDAYYTSQVFAGAFLDGHSSAVYGAFLAIAGFWAAWLKTRSPKLTFMSLFATIFVDVFASYGPLLPTANYEVRRPGPVN